MQFEFDEHCKDVEDEIKKILLIQTDDKRKIELLIDGGIFARMLAFE